MSNEAFRNISRTEDVKDVVRIEEARMKSRLLNEFEKLPHRFAAISSYPRSKITSEFDRSVPWTESLFVNTASGNQATICTLPESLVDAEAAGLGETASKTSGATGISLETSLAHISFVFCVDKLDKETSQSLRQRWLRIDDAVAPSSSRTFSIIGWGNSLLNCWINNQHPIL